MGHPLLELGNKTAVVIGGTSGIGLALVRGLAQAGANVVPTGRRDEQVRAAAAEVVAETVDSPDAVAVESDTMEDIISSAHSLDEKGEVREG